MAPRLWHIHARCVQMRDHHRHGTETRALEMTDTSQSRDALHIMLPTNALQGAKIEMG